MSMKIITPLAALIIAANVWAIAPAVDKEYDSKQASVINHKLDNLDNQADLDDNVTYQATIPSGMVTSSATSLCTKITRLRVKKMFAMRCSASCKHCVTLEL